MDLSSLSRKEREDLQFFFPSLTEICSVLYFLRCLAHSPYTQSNFLYKDYEKRKVFILPRQSWAEKDVETDPGYILLCNYFRWLYKNLINIFYSFTHRARSYAFFKTYRCWIWVCTLCTVHPYTVHHFSTKLGRLKVVDNENGGGSKSRLLLEYGFGPWRSMSVYFLMWPSYFLQHISSVKLN